MTLREGFFLFVALVGFASSFVMALQKKDSDARGEYLQGCLDRAHCEIEEYKKILGLKKNKQRAFLTLKKQTVKKRNKYECC